MTTAIALRFELGRYHANPWGEHVNEGLVEWPPSPWRILRALYSALLTSAELGSQRQEVERALQALLSAPPPSYSLPSSHEGHTRHFMPSRAWSPATQGKTDLIVDAFRAVAPEDEMVVLWDAELSEAELRGLGAAASRLGYLGRSESVCSARLLSPPDPELRIHARPAGEQRVGEPIELLAPAPGARLEDIAIAVGDLRRRKLSLPPGACRVTYDVDAPELPAPSAARAASPRPELALLHLGGSNRPGIAEAVAVGQSLRAALQRRYDGAGRGVSSATLSGRAEDEPRADQHQHAHYIALPDEQGRRVERLVVWAPEGLGAEEVRALAALSQLTVRSAGDPMPLALAALGQTAQMRIPDLLGPAKRWRSMTPFGLVRHPKWRGGALKDAPEEQVLLELRRRGFPEPVQIALLRGSWHRFRRSRVGQSQLQRARVFGFTLEFSQPVRGPIALGALCHFGLGVFVPAGRV
jgi:CRISPR-associated protein Csb2